jgi:NADH:ubiquinone oxidoreductase subunit F (NADH-binding)/NADH:ubiquinone oxidoreductase subunit E
MRALAAPKSRGERMDEVGGQRVAVLDRRYGRRGIEVLDRLREAKRRRGRLEREDVARVAVELGLPRAHVNGAASFFSDLNETPHGRRRLRVCIGTACLAATGGTHMAEAARGLNVEPGTMREDGSVSLEGVDCLGYCYGGPSALDGERPLAGADLVDQIVGRAEQVDPPIPFACAAREPVVLAGLLGIGPAAWTIWADIVSHPGGRQRVVREVTAANLRGRGGAEFPAARKWVAAAQGPVAEKRYVIANGDEGDPGSYIDRLLLERDPHRVLEGLALAALASGASRGYVYVRSEYPVARDAVRQAVVEARDAGHLGRDVHGSGVDFDVEVFEGAGSYVAGEETSLIRSMEGLRGNAVPRPPYPTDKGLFGAPTAVNNVETLASVPWILANGGTRFAELGKSDSRGTKVICLNERFAHPGAYEVELGTTIRSVVEKLGGGLRDGRELRGLLVGGPLGTFLGPGQLDVEIGFAAMDRVGVTLGHGGLVAIDGRLPLDDLVDHAWRFAASESCGACVPCRVGTKRGQELAARARGRRLDSDEDALQRALFETMRQGSLCSFGRSVPSAVESIMRVWGQIAGAEVPAPADSR